MQPDPDLTSDVPGMALWGWMSPAELRWLTARAGEMRTVVEIGCLHGRSSWALAAPNPGTKVFCIDPWSDDGWASWNASVGQVLDNVFAVRAPSPQAGVHVPDPVDMVFIDGAHDYDSVMADVVYWRDRAQVLLCGHDYVPFSSLPAGVNPGFPDVPRVVDEVFGDRVQVAPDTAIWYVKPNAPRG